MNGPGKSDEPVVPNGGPGPSGTPANQPEPQRPAGYKPVKYWDFWERQAQAKARIHQLDEKVAEMKRAGRGVKQGRGLAKDNAGQRAAAAPVPVGRGGATPADPAKQVDWTQSHAGGNSEDLSQALERIRQAACRDKELRFTSLWHHVYNPDQLREAYLGLKRQAAPGIDGQTWGEYGEKLEENLLDLSQRLARGTYRASPVRRVYIPKGDGRQRPIGIPALEDKIVQRATVKVLNAVYEQDFLGFSYGFRPKRECHMALDALAVGIQTKKVNWILDADIRGFFDSIDHECLIRLIEKRIADQRVIRHIRKWLKAGVLEEGKVREQEEGTPQGGSISPLLANIYLHYALDLWVGQWRKTQARGDVIIVRYADDFVAGFQHEKEADRFLAELKERFRQFNLELHAEKTRLIEFGRFAAERRAHRGEGRPETFKFLGFVHICDTTRDGRFIVLRRTRPDRMRAKLKEIREGLWRRLHAGISATGRWLRSVVQGYMNYHAIPRNLKAVSTFRCHVVRLWRWVIGRRSQKGRINWQKMARIAEHWLPRPCVLHPYPSERLCVMIQGKSPVR
jgi:RNA-directed DNA polymerase